MARLLANENVPANAVAALRSDGHDVSWMRDVGPGSTDDKVVALALAEGRILLTFDKDFGELAFRLGQAATPGVILLRPRLRSPDMTKWKRLFNALVEFQNEHQVGNHVLVFIKRAMDPARYVEKPHVFHARRHRLNTVLALCGLSLGEDGQIHRADAARTVDQALERANRLHAALVQRAVHADVLKFCNAEILQQNYFHAVFEAMKSITSKIRTLSGLSGDGVDLVHAAFGMRDGPTLLAINRLDTESLRGEQRGFVNLLKGLYGTIRNPLAHNPRVEWDMTEQDALDIMTTISLVHRKLDNAHRHRR